MNKQQKLTIMGTRHRQAVIAKNGELKIQQYGQWDGYPSGQGIDILEYLRNADLNKYHENLIKIRQATEDDIEEVNKSLDWQKDYPYLSRDCGANIHAMIEAGEVKFVQFISEAEAKTWCSGFFTIDFSKNEFTTEYHDLRHTFKLDSLPSNEEYLALLEPED